MEIKFRGKSKLNGKWHFGSYINLGDDWCQIIPTKGHDDGIPYNSIRVISETVGLFSGFKDESGLDIDIYDGDIFEGFGEGIKYFLVKFEDGAMYLYNNYGKWGLLSKFFEIADKFKIKVVVKGNIYDNPELLEVLSCSKIG